VSIALVEVQVFSSAPDYKVKRINGALAERLRRGLQNLLDEFDSRTCLHEMAPKGGRFLFQIRYNRI
jgi:hypothetical protein